MCSRPVSALSPAQQHLPRLFLLVWLLVCTAWTGWAQGGADTLQNPEEKFSLDREQRDSPSAVTLKVSCFCLCSLFIGLTRTPRIHRRGDRRRRALKRFVTDVIHPVFSQSAQESLTILDASSNINENSLECDGSEVRGTLRDSSAGLPGELAVGSLIGASNLR